MAEVKTSEDSWWMRSLLRAGVLLAVIFAARWAYHTQNVVIDLEVKTSAGTSAQLYFATDKQVFEEGRHVSFALRPDGEWHRYKLTLPPGRWKQLRFDPDAHARTVGIS